MFDPDFAFDIPTGSSLLAEVGIRPEHVREVVEDDRAIRCPDRGAAYPVHGFAGLAPDRSLDHGLHEAGPDEPRDPAPAHRPAGRRWRRA